jgi:ElaB/YqjD/DUF883 family membrane-anchored ribosome-binding protein
MDQEPDMIRQQIDETRSSLTEKLESLEAEVKGTVRGARATVEDTIETVKASVQETVDSVKRTFDVKYQVERHPWPMVAGSFVTGLLAGRLFGRRPALRPAGEPYRESESVSAAYVPSMREEPAFQQGNGSTTGTPRAEAAQPGMLDRLIQQFEPEIAEVKGMAVGALLGLVRDLAKQAVPPTLAPKVEEIMNSVTTKLGGKPFRQPILTPSHSTGPASGREFERP